jgi:hypothetical protein
MRALSRHSPCEAVAPVDEDRVPNLLRLTLSIRSTLRLVATSTRAVSSGRRSGHSDELQGIFRVSYDLLADAGKEARWKSYDHAEHGFVYVRRGADGVYAPDPVQVEAVWDSIAFFEQYLK